MQTKDIPGSSEKRLTGKGGKLNTSQAEPVAANSWAVGQFPSTGSCKKIHACLNLPALFLPTDLGSQCTTHQP